ncbi:MAG: HAMP domain-containing histidine kinase [Synechococcales cyanobacterium K44_A2020_017]|nr:HAMP domain-containing histidine kinase [Synechococcales cyanobacterium K32_A2020_035]MBF2096020.1 HAMP domain-containing histidine kinase [Synechococcales cyanobacterium K44_A2020_017]
MTKSSSVSPLFSQGSTNLETELSLSSRSTQLPILRPRQWLAHLKVGQKIAVGYLMALGLAVVGITAGISLSMSYRDQAKTIREGTLEDIALLQQLQSNLLHARIHQQQVVSVTFQPDRLPEQQVLFNSYAEQFQRTWFEFIHAYQLDDPQVSNRERERFQTTVELYNRSVGQYFRETRLLLDQLEAEGSYESMIQVQDQLLAFELSDVVTDLEQFSKTLDSLLETALEKGDAADVALAQAERTSTLIISLGVILSVAIALVMAIYTSRAISRPLRDVTAIAKRVAEDSDFSLQAPVTTRDEVGILALSLNHLIRQVDHLVDDLKASTAQQLIASEKMSSLGQMLAGVAHEINNPVNFIYGNVIHANDYIQDLLDLIHLYQTEIPDTPISVKDKIEEIDLLFIEHDLPKIVQSMKLGADRTRQIVLSLRNFSRIDESRPRPVDLHECIDNTVLILHNRLKRGIQLVRCYGSVPTIEGYTGSLYQVFMNLISNAIDALLEQAIGSNPGSPSITISTLQKGDRVQISIADNGPGIPPDHLDRIFDTFFTTKPTGKGTGLGLSICRQIVESKHGGQLLCDSTLQQGTTFTILLPIHQAIAPPALDPVDAARPA